MNIERGQVYELGNERRVIVQTGGSDDLPLFGAMQVNDGLVSLEGFAQKSACEIAAELEGWSMIGNVNDLYHTPHG